MYYIAICDDDKSFISYMESIIEKVKEEIYIEYQIYEYLSGEAFVCDLEEGLHFDLLILDIQLGGIDGNETAQLFRKRFPDAVLAFCSGAYLPTVESFKVIPFRYLLKKQKFSDLVKEMKEVINEVERRQEEPFIIGHYRKVKRKIKLKDILYIENSKRGGSIIFHSDCIEIGFAEKILVDKKPKELEEDLKKFGFALVHGSYLVNMNHIESIYSEEFTFDTGETVGIARAYRKSFNEAFARYFSNKYI